MSGCIHFSLFPRQAYDKLKWNNHTLTDLDSSFSNATFTNIYSISNLDPPLEFGKRV